MFTQANASNLRGILRGNAARSCDKARSGRFAAQAAYKAAYGLVVTYLYVPHKI